MRYCESCGTGHDCNADPDREPTEVTLARIHKDEAVEIARLQARQDRDYNGTRVEVAEIEADAEVDAATAVATILTAEDEPDAEPEPDPIVVDIPDAEPEPEPDNAPPAVESHSGSEPKARDWWSGYR